MFRLVFSWDSACIRCLAQNMDQQNKNKTWPLSTFFSPQKMDEKYALPKKCMSAFSTLENLLGNFFPSMKRIPRAFPCPHCVVPHPSTVGCSPGGGRRRRTYTCAPPPRRRGVGDAGLPPHRLIGIMMAWRWIGSRYSTLRCQWNPLAPSTQCRSSVVGRSLVSEVPTVSGSTATPRDPERMPRWLTRGRSPPLPLPRGRPQTRTGGWTRTGRGRGRGAPCAGASAASPSTSRRPPPAARCGPPSPSAAQRSCGPCEGAVRARGHPPCRMPSKPFNPPRPVRWLQEDEGYLSDGATLTDLREGAPPPRPPPPHADPRGPLVWVISPNGFKPPDWGRAPNSQKS